MNRSMKKLMIVMVVGTLMTTTGCARFFHGGYGGKGGGKSGGHGTRFVQQQPLSSEALNRVVKNDDAQLVALSD